MMKTCTKCKIAKPIEDFRFRYKNKGDRAPWCRSCFAAFERERWQSDPDRRSSVKQHSKERRVRNQRFVYDYLKDHPCVDCGENDPIVLEFDHKDRSVKAFHVSDISRRAYSLATIIAEIEKCDIRCANCHRRKTATQLGWHKGLESGCDESNTGLSLSERDTLDH